MQPQPFPLADRSRRRPKLNDPYEGDPYDPQQARALPAPAPETAPQPPIITKKRERKIDILIRQKIEDEVQEGRVPIITPCYNNLDDPTRPAPEYIQERLQGRSAAQTRATLPTHGATQTYLLPEIKDTTNVPAAQTSHNDEKPIVNDARKRVRRPVPRPDTSYLTRGAETHRVEPAPQQTPAVPEVVIGDTPKTSYSTRLSESRRSNTAPQHPQTALGAVITDAPRPPESFRMIAAPPHPRSALEDIISDAPNDAIGEETYASLKGMAEDRSEELEDIIVEDQQQDLTQVEKDHRQEDLALEALNKRLNITQTTVQDANRGLRRLSNKIDNAQAAHMHMEEPRTAPLTELHTNLHPERHREIPQEPALRALLQPGHVTTASQPHICCACHNTQQSIWGQLWTEFASNFYAYDATRDFSHNITWLGWTTILWIMWLMTEMALYPYFADELFGPLFPFVTMNVCLRPFMPILVPTFRFLSWAIGIVLNIAFGETHTSRCRSPPGRVTSRVLDTAASITGTTASITKDIAYSTLEAANQVHEHMGMAYDEYL